MTYQLNHMLRAKCLFINSYENILIVKFFIYDFFLLTNEIDHLIDHVIMFYRLVPAHGLHRLQFNI